MSGKSPSARDQKKTPQKSLKEKRAEKRAKLEPEQLIKPRKSARP
ncbi:hypothetical protein [Microbacterium marinilacus]|uniref:Uncharacterized protein n=1 Tax=Microbacterium marinilacus TaxID=415209 RepID=A0ABP7B9M3_9MICO|nr:hypothetical protein [Microbacterium marinilacus]